MVKALAEKYPSIKVYGYDPAVEEFEKMPTNKVDFVICTDVLEHIPEDELPDTISRIASLSQNVFFHLHHGKAAAILPNGENAHCTVYSPAQYEQLFKKFFPTLTVLPGLSPINSSCVTFPLPRIIFENWYFLLNFNTTIYADTWDSLMSLINSREEVIVLPIGVEGQRFLELFKYFGIINKISCIAAFKVDGGFKQSFMHEVPVIPFANLKHFSKTALLIVVTAENHENSNLHTELVKLGFLSIIFIENEVHAQIKKHLDNFYATGQALIWYMKRLDEKITDMEGRIYEKNEVQAVHTKSFAEYRNAFRGKKIVIVGNGPTLNYYEPIKDAIHIGLNFGYLKDNINLDYLFFQDVGSNRPLKIMREFKDNYTKIKHKIFIGRLQNHVDYNWIGFSEDYSLVGSTVVAQYFVKKSLIGQQIYQDICMYSLSNFGSVVFPALQFALFTYPSEIYLAGCDVSNTGDFHNQDSFKAGLIKWSLAIAKVKLGYARFKMFAEQYYPETEIISINPVGLRGLFKDIYTDEYKNSVE